MGIRGFAARGSAIQTLVGTDPIAGVEISESVPGPAGTLWRLISISFQLVTDATAVKRTVSLVVDTGAAAEIYYAVAADFTQARNSTVRYSLGVGIISDVVLETVLMPIPTGLFLLFGDRFRTVTNNIQAGDNFGPPTFEVELFGGL